MSKIGQKIIRKRRICNKIRKIVFIAIVMLIATFTFTNSSTAENKPSYYKEFTSHMVKRGETLTTYANMYANGCTSTKKYVEEVIFINHLDEDGTIYRGKTIILPKYIIVENDSK